MSESVLTLASVYKGWDRHHHLLSEVVRPLSAEQLALRAAPQLRSIGELVAHVIAVRARCLYICPGGGRSILGPLVTWDRTGAPVCTSNEVPAQARSPTGRLYPLPCFFVVLLFSGRIRPAVRVCPLLQLVVL